MWLTKVTYSMSYGAPVNVFDSGTDPSGLVDSTTAIQAAADVSVWWVVDGSTSITPS